MRMVVARQEAAARHPSFYIEDALKPGCLGMRDDYPYLVASSIQRGAQINGELAVRAGPRWCTCVEHARASRHNRALKVTQGKLLGGYGDGRGAWDLAIISNHNQFITRDREVRAEVLFAQLSLKL